MPVEDKLVEARFFLRSLESSVQGSIEYRHFLSAYLTSAWGVTDWLLQEYAGKYFGLSINDYVNESLFKFAAKIKGLPDADKFFLWYSSEVGRLLNESPGRYLHRKRVELVHRGGQPAFTMQLIVPQTVSIGGFASLSSSGSFLTTSPPPSQQPAPSTNTQMPMAAAEVYFSDYQNEGVNALCGRLIQSLEIFVQDTRRQFP